MSTAKANNAAAAKPRLSWRKQPNETGLAAVGQGPRGAILKVNGDDVANVYAHGRSGGWYYVARNNSGTIPLRNTCDKVVKDLEAAKAACEAYVRECLAKGSA